MKHLIFRRSVQHMDDFSYLRPQDVQPINRLGYTVLEQVGAQLEVDLENELKRSHEV